MSAALALSSFERSYAKGRQYFENIVSFLDSMKGMEMNLSQLERELKKRGLELMRQLLQEHVDSRSPGLCVEAVVGADGVERLRIRPQERKVETVFGTIEESRAGYGQEGVEGFTHWMPNSTCLPSAIRLKCVALLPLIPQKIPSTRQSKPLIWQRVVISPNVRSKN